ncbi:fungal-specific transcription factor domain-containing protein [Lentinula guzmanii]|uniref:Fungal-specific transcription factor domain-containing protein n=1 Tax=Lentinula guzmanii TaxID=2804957 RepID=A0AA38JAM5_9AGAR|nr:fungal-specific transcription factor domain-containing protein [Lentinula guzmanii]
MSSSSTSTTSARSRKSQATSCAECRRLKLKCDRVFPCAACIRRGCGNLCPNGTLEKGKRGFLKRLEQALPASSTKNGADGHESSEVAVFVSRDAAMAKRIQELEAALIEAGVDVPGLPRSTHGRSKSNSKTNKRARAGSHSSETDETNTDSAIPISDSNDVAVGFGTLTIDPKNRSRYIGLSSGSAYLDSDMWGSRGKEDQCLNSTYEDFLEHDLELQILATLSAFPPYEEAVGLANNYFRNVSFMYEIIPRETFFSKHLPAIYNDSIKSLGTPLLQHTVALVGVVLALGQYYDLEKPRPSVRIRAAELFRLSSFALNSHNIIDGGPKIHTLQGLQTLHLMALFNLSMKDEEGAENAWQLLGLAVRSMQAQGFHIDPSRWSLPAKDLEERRRVFWETYMYDCLQCFTVGRPCAQSELHFDCKMPTTCDYPLPSDSDLSNSTWSHTRWHIFKFKWAQVLSGIMDNIFSVRTPSTYSAIMQYDQQINDFYFSLPQWILSPYVKYPVNRALWAQLYPEGANGKTQYDPYKGLGKPENQIQCSQMNSLATMIFMATLHLHRGPFCRALMLEPQKMLKSQYERSIARVVSSSTAIINVARGMFVSYPNLTSRLWYWVFHAFSAAVCQAVFVIVAPFHPLASHAFCSLREAIELFKQADGKGARTATVRLLPLVEKAAQSMAKFRNATQEAQPGRAIKMPPLSRADDEVTASNVSDLARFPESNARKTEDFLGASTKLVRLPEDFHRVHSDGASMVVEHTNQQNFIAAEQQQQPPFPDPFGQMMGLYDNRPFTQNQIDQIIYSGTSSTSRQISTSDALSQTWSAGRSYHATSNDCPISHLSSSSSRPDSSVPAPLASATSGDSQRSERWESSFHPSSVGMNTENHADTLYDHSSSLLPDFNGISGSSHPRAPDTVAPVIGYMHPGLHFNDVNGFNLSNFIQDGAKAWAYEPLT